MLWHKMIFDLMMQRFELWEAAVSPHFLNEGQRVS